MKASTKPALYVMVCAKALCPLENAVLTKMLTTVKALDQGAAHPFCVGPECEMGQAPRSEPSEASANLHCGGGRSSPKDTGSNRDAMFAPLP